ncbi:MAG: hypothetical protein Kapaf2KO_16230 [Candidatus Kapaibacteriales bacterium]
MNFIDRYATVNNIKVNPKKINNRCKIRMFNAITLHFVSDLNQYLNTIEHSNAVANHIHKDIWCEHLLEDIQDYTDITSIPFSGEIITINGWHTEVQNLLYDHYYFRIYAYLEGVCQWYKKLHYSYNGFFTQYNIFIDKVNLILEVESTGYTLVEGKILLTFDTLEVNEVKELIKNTNTPEECKKYITKAWKFLSADPKPDYVNTIKESMTACELLVQKTLGKSKIKFSAGLDEIFQRDTMHNSLKESMKKLYGFTSDIDGARHGKYKDKVNITHADAKYVLVTASAFINYITVKVNE